MWGRVSAVVACAALLAGAASVGAPDRAAAAHGGKNCGIVSEGSSDYRVRAQELDCDKALRGARRYLRSGAGLNGFSCDEPAGRTEFFCKSGTRVYWAVRL